MKSKRIKGFIIAIICILVLLSGTLAVFLLQYSDGDEKAYAVINDTSEEVTVETEGDSLAFVPEGEYDTGIIFYPGAKLKASVYAPLASKLAEAGYLCVVIGMPVNLSLLDHDAAMDEMEKWPDVENWYIGGHSMGGTAAEKCAFENENSFAGLIILASRIKYDFSESDLPVLAVYATNDNVCSVEKVEKLKTALPRNYIEIIIEGGCHRYFGSYEKQMMDGEPTISWESQQEQTIEAITGFIDKNRGS